MSESSKHSVAVSVRIRPGGTAVAPVAGGIECGGAVFGYPVNVLEGSDQEGAATALVSGLVRRFLRGGISCTLLAYGQTGSGKTYTMFGPPGSLTEASLEKASGAVPDLWGAFPRAMMELMAAPELSGATFHASAIEIYMEHAYDLLDGRKSVKVGSAKGAGRGNLVVGDIGKAPVLSGDIVIVGGVHPSGCSCFHCFKKTGGLVSAVKRQQFVAEGSSSSAARKTGVPKLSKAKSTAAAAADADQFGTEGETMWPLRTPADVAKLARLVESERVAHSHALNDRSSRSHCLIKVQCTHIEGGRSQKRQFLFVDLAGSERIAKTEVTGARQKEAANINQSLTTLGRVVKELRERRSHVSYRDSALTMLLRASFDGPSCTSVVVNVSSWLDHAEETLCSLRFGEKLSSVQTSSVVAQPTDVGAQRAHVSAELHAARARLAELDAAGQGDHIGGDAVREGRTAMGTLRKNLEMLAEREAEMRALKVQVIEAKASGRAGGDLVSRLEAAEARYATLNGIVEQEKTIKGLWVAATPGYKRVEAQVAALTAQMEMLGGQSPR